MKFLTRSGCHLCDEARPVVEAAARRLGLSIEEIDVDSDENLVRDYGDRIPVVLGPGDVVVAEGIIEEPRRLRRAMRRSARSGG